MLSYSSSAHTEQAIFENVKAGFAHSVMEWGLLRPIHLSHLNGAIHSAYVRVANYSGFEGSVTLVRESLASRELRLRLKSLSSSLSSHQRHRFPFAPPLRPAGGYAGGAGQVSLLSCSRADAEAGDVVMWCCVVLTTLSVAHRQPEGGRSDAPIRPVPICSVSSRRTATHPAVVNFATAPLAFDDPTTPAVETRKLRSVGR